MLCLTLALLPALAAASTLFIFNQSDVATLDDRLSLRVHRPSLSHEPVIVPTEAWESWAVLAYNSVLLAEDGLEYRLYYDCIEGTGVPPGRRRRRLQSADGGASSGAEQVGSGAPLSARRVCLATSSDGITWNKPKLGVFNRLGSTANNILVEDSGNSVFIDRNPATPPEARYKMVCSRAAYQSPDGIRWTKMPWNDSLAEDDTKPTAQWVPSLKKYVVFVRRDTGAPAGKTDSTRFIGRCTTGNLSNWQQEIPAGSGGCEVVFGADGGDPDHLDIYTNSWTPYPSIDDPDAIHLFFPSMYAHFPNQGAPYGYGNDGLLDIRLTYARGLAGEGGKIVYTGAANSRSPFVPLGVSTCAAHSPSVKGGWCNVSNGELASTSFDTSVTYMTSGYVPSVDGTEIFMYSSGQPFTHGSDGAAVTWGPNTGLRLLRLRKDGFVSVDAPYFHDELAAARRRGVESEELPSPPGFTTHPLEVPQCSNGKVAAAAAASAAAGASVTTTTTTTTAGATAPRISVNFQTSVVGSVKIEVMPSSAAAPAAHAGLGMADADPLVGSAVDAVATWGGRATTALPTAMEGKTVILRVEMIDAQLYAIRIECA